MKDPLATPTPWRIQSAPTNTQTTPGTPRVNTCPRLLVRCLRLSPRRRLLMPEESDQQEGDKQRGDERSDAAESAREEDEHRVHVLPAPPPQQARGRMSPEPPSRLTIS